MPSEIEDPLNLWDEEIAALERAIKGREAENDRDRERLDRLEIARSEYRALGLGQPQPTAPEPKRRSWMVDNETAVFRIVDEAEGLISDQEVLDALVAAGWKTTALDPLSNVRNYLSRLYTAGKIQKPKRMTYASKRSVAPAQSTSSPGDVVGTIP